MTSESRDPDRETLASIPASAFDGHTEFHNMSAEERLAWLSEVAKCVVARRSMLGKPTLRPLDDPSGMEGSTYGHAGHN